MQKSEDRGGEEKNLLFQVLVIERAAYLTSYHSVFNFRNCSRRVQISLHWPPANVVPLNSWLRDNALLRR